MQIIDRDRRERMKEGGGGDLEVREEESKEERECLPECLPELLHLFSPLKFGAPAP